MDWKDDTLGPLLFDRKNDPGEMKNLAGNPGYADVQASLEACLQRWMEETDDPFETGERDPRTGMLLLGQEYAGERWIKKLQELEN
ncbi:MAG: hypothetical protein KAX80_04845 [Planctomycetes bacterium]|nr:hypothetical protein [Planctomycetota bacterium]